MFLEAFLLVQHQGGLAKECKGCKKYENIHSGYKENIISCHETMRAQLTCKMAFPCKRFSSSREIQVEKRRKKKEIDLLCFLLMHFCFFLWSVCKHILEGVTELLCCRLRGRGAVVQAGAPGAKKGFFSVGKLQASGLGGSLVHEPRVHLNLSGVSIPPLP